MEPATGPLPASPPEGGAGIRRPTREWSIPVVIAAVVLLLVGAGAAYPWLTSNTANPPQPCFCFGPQRTLTIGGSVSMYPFDSLAVTQFEQNNSDIVISDNQGGTSLVMLAVCRGSIDIGTASAEENLSGLEATDQCPTTTIVTPVAYDVVDIVVADGNPHALESIQWDTLTAIYDHASLTNATLVAGSIDGASTHAPSILSGLPKGPLDWDQIPACVPAAAGCGGLANPTERLAVALGPGVACPTGEDICSSGTGASPCGFTVCAGPMAGDTSTDPIETVGRSDHGATTQTFEARLLEAGNSRSFAKSFEDLGFAGCGSNNSLFDCGINATLSASGFSAMVATVASTADALGYAADSSARATGSQVAIVPYLAMGQGAGNGTGYQEGGILPTLGESGTVQAGITASRSIPNYAGWCPFLYVTTTSLSGWALEFMQFVVNSQNNAVLSAEAGVTSVYSVTPIESFPTLAAPAPR
jgi:ABC-type phosphate transport system substrate-binding protein